MFTISFYFCFAEMILDINQEFIDIDQYIVYPKCPTPPMSYYVSHYMCWKYDLVKCTVKKSSIEFVCNTAVLVIPCQSILTHMYT